MTIKIKKTPASTEEVLDLSPYRKVFPDTRPRVSTPQSLGISGKAGLTPVSASVDSVLDTAPTYVRDRIHQDLHKEATRSARWDIRAIFAFGRSNGQPTSRKQVGVFIHRPVDLPPEIKSSIIDTSAIGDRRSKLEEARKRSSALLSKEVFLIESDGPSGIPKITRQGLVKHIRRLWETHPVSKKGDVTLYYEHVEVFLPMEAMRNTERANGLFENIKRILTLMEKGIRFDPWLRSLRKAGEIDIKPEVMKR